MSFRLTGLLWWMAESPYSSIDGQDWSAFLGELVDYLLPVGAFGIACCVLAYYLSARSKYIYKPSDLFAPYTPMRSLWLCVLPGMVMIFVFTREFLSRFSMSVPFSLAIMTGIWTSLLVLAVSYGIACLPGLTPPKFRYRPWPKWLL